MKFNSILEIWGGACSKRFCVFVKEDVSSFFLCDVVYHVLLGLLVYVNWCTCSSRHTVRCDRRGGKAAAEGQVRKRAAISASEREEGACFSSCNLEEDVGCILWQVQCWVWPLGWMGPLLSWGTEELKHPAQSLPPLWPVLHWDKDLLICSSLVFYHVHAKSFSLVG